MTKPTRATAGGRAYLDLRKLARARQRPTDELLQLYALEGFLARLPLSPHAKHFVLKGGVLLAAFDARRPTKDIDLSASGITNDPESVRRAIQSVLEVRLDSELDDGLAFAPDSTKAQVIRDGDEYSGVRVTVPCTLESARVDFHVDVNVGDPISPAPSTVSVPRILGGEPLRVTGYPITMVLAEKVVTAIQRGTANTRWRDFADIAILSRRHAIKASELRQAIDTVAKHRETPINPLRTSLSGLADVAQAKWAAWRRRGRMEDQLPESIEDLLEELAAFIDPVLIGQESVTSWDPDTATWA